MTSMEKTEQHAVIKHCVCAGMTPVDMLKFMNAGKSCKRVLYPGVNSFRRCKEQYYTSVRHMHVLSKEIEHMYA